MAKMHMERRSISYVIREMQTQTTRHPTHLLEWPQSGILTAQNADEMWGSRSSHSLLVGCQNGAATLEDSLQKCLTFL